MFYELAVPRRDSKDIATHMLHIQTGGAAKSKKGREKERQTDRQKEEKKAIKQET